MLKIINEDYDDEFDEFEDDYSDTITYSILDEDKNVIDSYTEEYNEDDINDQDEEGSWPGLLDAIEIAEDNKKAYYITAENINYETMLLWTREDGRVEEYFK